MQGAWIEVSEPFLFHKRLRNATLGISVGQQEGRIAAVTFIYKPSGYKGIDKPYVGTTDRGIGATSSKEDVIKKYGTLPSISTSDTEGGPTTCYLYALSGIDFVFDGEELVHITVFEPYTDMEH